MENKRAGHLIRYYNPPIWHLDRSLVPQRQLEDYVGYEQGQGTTIRILSTQTLFLEHPLQAAPHSAIISSSSIPAF